MPPGLQRIGQLAELPALLRELGAEPAAVLARVGVQPADLANRDNRLPYATVARLLGESARTAGCSHFGLLLGARWRLEDMGLPGELAANCATIGQAIQNFTALHWLNASGGVAYLGRKEAVTTLGYAVYEPGLADGVQHVYDCTLAVGVSMLRQLSGNGSWAPSVVRLSRPRSVSRRRSSTRATSTGAPSRRSPRQGAFADVSNALVDRQKLGEQVAAQQKLVAALRDYSRLARIQYDGGYVPYSTVLQAEQQLFPAELALATTRAAVRSALAPLSRAAPRPPCPVAGALNAGCTPASP